MLAALFKHQSARIHRPTQRLCTDRHRRFATRKAQRVRITSKRGRGIIRTGVAITERFPSQRRFLDRERAFEILLTLAP